MPVGSETHGEVLSNLNDSGQQEREDLVGKLGRRGNEDELQVRSGHRLVRCVKIYTEIVGPCCPSMTP